MNKWVLFGHHFAAIAGAAPPIGPVLAAAIVIIVDSIRVWLTYPPGSTAPGERPVMENNVQSTGEAKSQ